MTTFGEKKPRMVDMEYAACEHEDAHYPYVLPGRYSRKGEVGSTPVGIFICDACLARIVWDELKGEIGRAFAKLWMEEHRG